MEQDSLFDLGAAAATALAALLGGGDGAGATIEINRDLPAEYRPLRLAVPGRVFDARPGDLRDIALVDDPWPALEIGLGPAATDWLAATTEAHLGQPMQLIVCGAEIMAPIIQEPIRGGRVAVTGAFDIEDLALIAGQIAGQTPCPDTQATEGTPIGK